MADVYSTQMSLFSGVGFTPVLVLVAPDGYRSVITTISATTGDNALLTWWKLYHVATGAAIAGATHIEGTTDYTCDLLAARWVLNEGDELMFVSDGSAWDLIISGFLLALP